MSHTGFRTFHFVSFLYGFFFSFRFLLFRFFSHCFLFVFFFAFLFVTFLTILLSFFFLFVSFWFFFFRFFFLRFSVYRYPLLVKFRWVLFSGFRGEVENVSANQRPGDHLGFPISPNANLVEDVEFLLPVKFREIPFSGYGEKSTRPNLEIGRQSWFSDRHKEQKLGRRHWIPFSNFRGEVENVSANLRLGWPPWFSNRPEKQIW